MNVPVTACIVEEDVEMISKHTGAVNIFALVLTLLSACLAAAALLPALVHAASAVPGHMQLD